jgi:hypothetical protein
VIKGKLLLVLSSREIRINQDRSRILHLDDASRISLLLSGVVFIAIS